jgi:hypothetical protein
MVRPHQRQPRGNANEEVKKTQRSVPKSTANVGPLQFQFPIDVQRTLNHRWQKHKAAYCPDRLQQQMSQLPVLCSWSRVMRQRHSCSDIKLGRAGWRAPLLGMPVDTCGS